MLQVQQIRVNIKSHIVLLMPDHRHIAFVFSVMAIQISSLSINLGDSKAELFVVVDEHYIGMVVVTGPATRWTSSLRKDTVPYLLNNQRQRFVESSPSASQQFLIVRFVWVFVGWMIFIYLSIYLFIISMGGLFFVVIISLIIFFVCPFGEKGGVCGFCCVYASVYSL